jgi:hypothetical protein
MDLDTFHNHADTLPSGFKALTEEDLDRIGRERGRAHRKRWIIIGLVALLAFLGCLAGTGYASTALSGGSAPAPAVHHKARAPAHRVARSQSPGKAVNSTAKSTAKAPASAAPASMPLLVVGSYSGTEPQMIGFSADGSNIVTNIIWQYWDATGAYGVGTSDILGCVPSCASGSSTRVTATITLTNPIHGQFTAISESRDGQETTTEWPQAAQQPDNTSVPDQTSQYQPYLTALANAGINAPSDWAIQTAQNLEAAWANGETEDQTNNQYLLPGGIYPQHLAEFNAIVHQYFG